MTETAPGTVTRLLEELARSEPGAAEHLWERIQGKLRADAHRLMANERPDHTLQATALVNEAYIRLLGGKKQKWDNAGHFFGAATRSMEQILIDHARARRRIKRGGDRERVPLEDHHRVFEREPAEILAMKDALDRLDERDQRKTMIARMRYFGELKIREIAALLEISETLVKTELSFTRAWLHREIGRGGTTIGERVPSDGGGDGGKPRPDLQATKEIPKEDAAAE